MQLFFCFTRRFFGIDHAPDTFYFDARFNQHQALSFFHELEFFDTFGERKSGNFYEFLINKISKINFEF